MQATLEPKTTLVTNKKRTKKSESQQYMKVEAGRVTSTPKSGITAI